MSTVTLDNKTILVTGAAGFIGSPQKKKDYSDIYKWYEYMRKSQIHRKANAPWAGKLVQIQMLLGTGVPTNVQIMLMKVYDTMKKIVGR